MSNAGHTANHRVASLVRWSVIWARTVARSWRSGIHDLYSRIP